MTPSLLLLRLQRLGKGLRLEKDQGAKKSYTRDCLRITFIVPTLGKMGEPSTLLTRMFKRLIRFLLKHLGVEMPVKLIVVDHQRNIWGITTQTSGLPMTADVRRAPFGAFLLAGPPRGHSTITQ